MLLTNAKLRVERLSYVEKIAYEIFDTFNKKSLTYKEMINYNQLVLKNLENMRFVRLRTFRFV